MKAAEVGQHRDRWVGYDVHGDDRAANGEVIGLKPFDSQVKGQVHL